MDVGHTHQEAGWWQASDLKWYPPELHPGYNALPAPPTSYAPRQLPTATFAVRDQQETAGAATLRMRHVLVLALCVAYVVSPVDFAPELLLGPLGVPDDLIAMVAAIGVYAARVRGRRFPGS